MSEPIPHGEPIYEPGKARTLRIAQLSDLHARSEAKDEYAFAQERVTKALICDLEQVAEKGAIDAFVFSGDLAYDGKAEALTRGRELLLDPLRERFPEAPIVLLPGNHDVDRDRIDRALEVGLRDVLDHREAVQERIANSHQLALDRARLSPWDAFVDAWDPKAAVRNLSPVTRLYEFEADGVAVRLGAFDTAWRASGGEEDRGRLILGVDQIHAFLEECGEADVRIAAFHHPPEWLAQFDSIAVTMTLQEAGLLILTGHEHRADPKLEVTPKGTALYSRAACAYEEVEHPNGYTVIDVHLDEGETEVQLRRWYSSEDRFLADPKAGHDGRAAFSWPTTGSHDLVVHRVTPAKVLEPLALLVQEHSVVADRIDGDVAPVVSNLVVEPRLWPVPHQEAFDRSVDRDRRPDPVDALERLAGKRALILSGPHMSGVTTSLLWLLDRHFLAAGTHIPAYVRADPRFSLRRINRAIATAEAHVNSGNGEPPRILLAVDDVEAPDSKALARLIKLLRDNENVTVILGCHGEVHETLARTLDKHDFAFDRVYLGRFGRRETRELVARIAGAEGSDLVQKVLDVVQRQGLPRNPLNLAALVSVINREPDLTSINESGLLSSYVQVLLDNPVAVDPEGLSMDFRRRQVLLQLIARHVIETERTRIQRGEIEQLVLDFFKSIGWTRSSAGQTVDSLIGRRILAEDERGVGFRYPALLHLFAAGAATEDEEFAEEILGNVMTYAPVVYHMAGLKRNDKELLEHVAGVASAIRAEVASAVEIEQFDLIEDRDGWSKIKSLKDARRLLRPPPEPPSEEELDDWYDDLAEDPGEDVELEPFRSPPSEGALARLMPAYSLVGSVLQSSELVPDVDFRAEILKEVIGGWSVMTVLMAIEEDMTREFEKALEPIFEDVEDEEKRASAVEHIARLFVIFFMSIFLYAETGSVHQEEALKRVLDDAEFVSRSANDLFASLLYAMLGFSGWPQRLSATYKRHSQRPMVPPLLRNFCRREYHANSLSGDDAKALEQLVIDLYMPADPPTEKVALAALRTDLRNRLRKSRVRSKWADRDAEADGEQAIEGTATEID